MGDYLQEWRQQSEQRPFVRASIYPRTLPQSEQCKNTSLYGLQLTAATLTAATLTAAMLTPGSLTTATLTPSWLTLCKLRSANEIIKNKGFRKVHVLFSSSQIQEIQTGFSTKRDKRNSLGFKARYEG